jgi:RimJ/RimL family protein N-acetyltransferase
MTSVSHPKSIMVSGARVALGPVLDEQAAFFNAMRNDLVVQKTTGTYLRPVTMDQTEKSIAGSNAPSEEQSIFTAYRIDRWEPIGTTSLRDISHFDGSAEFGITLAREHLNQGFGTETAQLVLAYGFHMLNLHNIYLTVDGFNLRGQRAYQKAGFREAGRYREMCIVERQRYDLIHMDCLAREFVYPEPLYWGLPE